MVRKFVLTTTSDMKCVVDVVCISNEKFHLFQQENGASSLIQPYSEAEFMKGHLTQREYMASGSLVFWSWILQYLLFLSLNAI